MSKDLKKILKPKERDFVYKQLDKKYPIFSSIFYKLFPKEKYQYNFHEDGGVDVMFTFSVKDKDKNPVHFLISDNEHFELPQIKVLKRTEREDIGGFFTDGRYVESEKDVKRYISKKIK